MNVFKRFATYTKNDVWRPSEKKVWVRKNRPGIGWTVNLAELRQRVKSR